MKLKILIIAILLSFSYSAHAQLSSMDLDSPGFIQLKGTKTYYVTTGDPNFDNSVLEAMKSSWNITPWDVLDGDKLDSRISDKTASFLVPEQGGMILINGGRKHLYNYTLMDFLASSPKHTYGNEKKITDCAFRVRNMIEAMIHAMDIVQKKAEEGGVAKEFRAVYNGKSKKIKERTLLISEEALKTIVYPLQMKNPKNFTDIEKIREKYTEIFSKSYPFRYEICSEEKVAKAIKEKSTEYFYLQPVFSTAKYMFVFDPSTGECVYFDRQVQGVKVTEKDIEKLVLAINGQLK